MSKALSINVLRSAANFVLEDGRYTPYDILFGDFFAEDLYGHKYENVRKWYPLSENTKQAMCQVLYKSISDNMALAVACLLYGISDGVYYTYDETAKKLGITTDQVISLYLLQISKAFYNARDEILATLPEDALKQLRMIKFREKLNRANLEVFNLKLYLTGRFHLLQKSRLG